MTIYLGADHNGWSLKEKIKASAQKRGFKVSDQGNLKLEADDDYPDFAKRVALMMKKNKDSVGILICGSGQGMCMSANRFPHLRATLGYSEKAVIKARQDEDANVLCLSGRELNFTQAEKMIKAFFHTEFSKIPRYKKRITKLSKLK